MIKDYSIAPSEQANWRSFHQKRREGSLQIGRKIALFSFQLFLIAQFFSLARDYFFLKFGQSLSPWATLANGGSLLFLFPTIIGYGVFSNNLFGYLNRKGRVWVVALAIIVSNLALYGWLVQGYGASTIIRESGAFLVILACAILGSIPQFWKDIYRTFIGLILVALGLNLAALSDITALITADGLRSRSGVESISYEIQNVLHLWPYFLFTARFHKRFFVYIIFLGVVFIFIQQLLYQKRIGTAEVIIYLTIFFVIAPRYTLQWSKSWHLLPEPFLRTSFLIICSVGLAFALLLAPQIINAQTSALIERFNTSDTARIDEAAHMLSSLNGVEYLIGRGMGGYFGRDGTHLKKIPFVFLTDVGVIGRRELHVGALMPMLKGGLLLMVVYYLGIAAVLWTWKQNKEDPLSFAAYIFVLVSFIYSLQGGMFILGDSYHLVLLGLGIGRSFANNTIRQAEDGQWLLHPTTPATIATKKNTQRRFSSFRKRRKIFSRNKYNDEG